MKSYGRRILILMAIGLGLVAIFTTACSNAGENTAPQNQNGKTIEKTLILGTTTTTRDTGLLEVLIPAFEAGYGIKTKVIVGGTGEVIEMAKLGNTDVIFVHSRKAEDEFVEGGYGINRRDVMYNTFVFVGPEEDPAEIAGEKDLNQALIKLYDAKVKFISRGDQSGTHKKEQSLWASLNVKPEGQSWYLESGQGMGDTLMMANEMGAYTLSDSGTWQALREKLGMRVVFEGDDVLKNPYGVIAVNPQKHPGVHIEEANAFIEFITSEEGQNIIRSYKKNGQSLFVPNAAR